MTTEESTKHKEEVAPERPKPATISRWGDGHIHAEICDAHWPGNEEQAVRISSENGCFSFSLEVTYMPDLRALTKRLNEMADFVEQNNERIELT